MDNRALEARPTWQEGRRWAHREYAMRRLEGFGGEVVLGDQMDQLAVERMESAEKSVAQPHGASHDRIENRLYVGWRTRDDTQNIAGRGLSGEGVRKVRV